MAVMSSVAVANSGARPAPAICNSSLRAALRGLRGPGPVLHVARGPDEHRVNSAQLATQLADVPSFRADVPILLPEGDADAMRERLMEGFHALPVPTEGVTADAASVAAALWTELSETRALGRLRGLQASLELLRTRPCPRWHQDKVAVRLLVTYFGHGTQWVEDEDALYLSEGQARIRAWLGQTDQPGSTTDARRGAKVWEAGPGDVLLLKGSGWPGRQGRGAVHRSPPGGCCEDDVRLVYKLDVIPEGGEGNEHFAWLSS